MDDTLRDAIEAAVRQATDEADVTQGALLAEYVVVASAHTFDDEGYPISQVIVIPRDGSESRILGLIEHARIRMQADVLGDQ